MAHSPTAILIGPEDDGRRMSLEEFARAEGRPGYLYELDKGVIQAVDVPGLPHALVVQNVRSEFDAYRRANLSRIFLIGGGAETGMQMYDLQSERHPDIAVYLTMPPVDVAQPWDQWTPDIAIEVVSESSAERDYEIKPGEYLRAGVRLYLIADPRDRSMTALTRRMDQWSKRVYRSGTIKISLLPEF